MLMILPTLVLVLYVVWPSAVSAVAVIHFYITEQQAVAQMSERDAIVRRVQKFFARYPVVITQHDIFVYHQHQVPFKAKGCLRHAIAIYVPFMLRYPVIGRTTYEWCLVVKK